jgi:hypothetical protein
MDDTQNEVVEVEQPKARYTSHPITNFRVGRFKFDKGQLALDNADEVAEFEKLLDSLPPVEKMKVRKIDIAAAERISAEYRAAQGGPTKNTDSSTGERATPKVGTGKLGDNNPEEAQERGEGQGLPAGLGGKK